MKKLILVAAMVLGMAGMTFAQIPGNTPVTGDVSLTAEVISALQLTPSGTTMDFGTIVQGAGAVSNPSGTEITYGLAGDAGRSVIVTFDNTATLSGPSSSTMTFTPAFVGGSTNSKTAAVNVTSPITLSGTPGSYGIGNYYFWLDGSISVAAAQTPGTYNGTWHLTLNY